MSSAFLDTARLTVSDDQGNTIWIRRKMDWGTKAAFLDTMGTKGLMGGAGSYSLLLAEYNFLDWAGPLFTDDAGRVKPCTPETIRTLDPDLEVVALALAAIARQNPPRTKADKKKALDTGNESLPGENPPPAPTTLPSS